MDECYHGNKVLYEHIWTHGDSGITLRVCLGMHKVQSYSLEKWAQAPISSQDAPSNLSEFIKEKFVFFKGICMENKQLLSGGTTSTRRGSKQTSLKSIIVGSMFHDFVSEHFHLVFLITHLQIYLACVLGFLR